MPRVWFGSVNAELRASQEPDRANSLVNLVTLEPRAIQDTAHSLVWFGYLGAKASQEFGLVLLP